MTRAQWCRIDATEAEACRRYVRHFLGPAGISHIDQAAERRRAAMMLAVEALRAADRQDLADNLVNEYACASEAEPDAD